MDESTLQRHAGKLPRTGPLPPAPDYKGVGVDASTRTAAVFVADFQQLRLGRFCTAEEAARAYDDAAREAGRCIVNFPRPGTDEVQAVKGEKEALTMQRAAGKRAPPRTGPLPPAPDYKGVSIVANARTAAVFKADLKDGGVTKFLGQFCTAEEAARAHDVAARKAGRRVVNFPRRGTGELQAVKGQEDKLTLAQHCAAQQAAGVAGAAGGIASPGMASPPTKRRAAAPPPSEPPRKRATSPSIKTESPAAAAPEAPAAPPPPPYRRRPPCRIGSAASPPPDDGPGLPASGIKTETPAAAKPEAPIAPPHARYTRRPPHRIERESSLPPGFVAPVAGIKTESPAAVKPEAPVAPPHVPYTASTGRPLQAAFAAAQAALAASLPPDDGPGLPASGIKPETPAAPPIPAAVASGWPSPALL